jgi:uncharacterized protein YrrD
MQLTRGACILSKDEREVGHLDRVVIDPKTNEITHLVIRKGFFSKENKVVPSDLVVAGKGEQIRLRIKLVQLRDLPDFEEPQVVLAPDDNLPHDAADPLKTLLPLLHGYLRDSATLLVPVPVGGRQLLHEHMHLPKETVAVKQGAKVLTREGTYAGSVEQMLTSQRGNHIAYFLISRGLVAKEKRLIPVRWVADFGENELHLAVSGKTIERLPLYETAEPRQSEI